ncbi:MAG: hypothetical protein HYY68_03540 [Thaumarchaeota archaeon]|nr:hypothetical protein [Nitrososphaerota archaeon]
MGVARTAGAVLNLLNALWAAYISFLTVSTPTSCPSNGCPTSLFTYLPAVLLSVAAILVVDSVICFVGLRIGFTVGVVLSAAIVVLVGAQWGTFGNLSSSLSIVLSALAIVFGLVSMRSGRGISEESHPLNLPVFG